jgi:hypothetical protein
MLTSVKLQGKASPALCTFCVPPFSLLMMVTVSPPAQSFVFNKASKFLFIYIHLCSFTELLIPWELNIFSLGRRPDMLIEALLLPYERSNCCIKTSVDPYQTTRFDNSEIWNQNIIALLTLTLFSWFSTFWKRRLASL